MKSDEAVVDRSNYLADSVFDNLLNKVSDEHLKICSRNFEYLHNADEGRKLESKDECPMYTCEFLELVFSLSRSLRSEGSLSSTINRLINTVQLGQYVAERQE